MTTNQKATTVSVVHTGSMFDVSGLTNRPPRTRSRREGEKMKKFNRRRQKAQAQEGLNSLNSAAAAASFFFSGSNKQEQGKKSSAYSTHIRNQPFLYVHILGLLLVMEGLKNIWGEPNDRPHVVEGACLSRTFNAIVSKSR